MSYTTILKAATATSVLSLALASQIAIAQDDTDESDRRLSTVTVTSQVREQSLIDVPVSVAVVDGVTLQADNLQKLEDIQYAVPNFSLTETGIATNIFIRGIGSGVNQAFEQSVGMYVDGVHYSRAQQTRAPFLDIQRVEVLRGPQSILFGKNSVAGALSITTAKPTDTFEGSILASYEFENEEIITEGYVSGPLSDRVRGRLALRYRDTDGYVENLRTGQNDPQREDVTARGTIAIDVTDNLEATFKAEFSDFDVTGRNFETFVSDPAAAGPFAGLTYGQILANVFGQDASVLDEAQDNVRGGSGEFSNNELQTYALNLDWQLGDYTLQSITALSSFEYVENCDCDFTGADIFSAGLQESYDQFSQEVRLISPEFESHDFILGAYYQTTEHEYADQIVVPGTSVLIPAVNAQAPGFGSLLANTQAAREAGVDADVISAFAQLNWHFADSWTLQLGGRFTSEEKDGFRNMVIEASDGSALPAAQAAAPLVYAGVFGITSENLAALGPQGLASIGLLGEIPVSGSRSEEQFSPDVKLQWDATDNHMFYASWSQGFKSGGFDFRANNRSVFATLEDSFEFEDEQATNYELGGKFRFGGTAELNAAAFFTEFDDLQVSIFDGILGFNVGNAASAEISGLELDGRWAATDHLTLSGSLALTDFEFQDFQNGQCYFGQVPDTDLDGDGTPELCDYSGNSNQLVSDLQGTLAADFTYPVFGSYTLDASADVFFTSEYDAAPTFDPDGKQGGYELFNLRLALSPDDDRWQIALLGKNVFDEQPLQYAGAIPLAGNTFGTNSDTGIFLQGRQVALQARLNF